MGENQEGVANAFVDVRLPNDVDHFLCECPSIIVYDQHSGHDPSAPHEVYHLKVHPNVIKCCMEDLFTVGYARHMQG